MQKAGSFVLALQKSEASLVKLFRILGILLVVVVPAAFWTSVIVFVCMWLGVTLSAQMGVLIGGLMCLFLGIIYAIIVVGAERTADMNDIERPR
jgi:hypothetical protein